MIETLAYHYWGTQTPVRLLFLFLLTAYSYLVKQSSQISGSLPTSSLGYGLQNGLVFTWAFLELGVWFLIYISLREERASIQIVKADEKDE
jgi:Increased loss of mitochondrial DNA protein 1